MTSASRPTLRLYVDPTLPPSSCGMSPKATVLFEESQLNSQRPPHRLAWQPTASAIQSARSYIAHATSRPARDSVSRAMPSGRRFIAGEAFFNYEAFGSLRPELAPVRIFSTAFLGLAVTALASGFAFTLLKWGFRQMLAEFLRVNNESLNTSVKYLLEWPGAFSIFLGFLSDCQPIRGKRRKPYMIIGWVLSVFCFAAIATLDFTVTRSWDVLDVSSHERNVSGEELKPRVSRYGGLLLGLTVVATLLLQLMYIAALSMTVEFAQREPLQERGKLQAMFFVLYYITAAIAQGVSTLFILPDEQGHVRSTLSLGDCALILGVCCLIPVPFLMAFVDEPPVRCTVHLSVRRRAFELWRFCHQNVVIRVLFFLVGHFFIIGLYVNNVRDALATWCNITPAKQPAVNAADFVGYCIALVFWMLFMTNWPWRRVAAIGTVTYILGYIFYTVMITYDVTRAGWFYMILLAMLDMPRAWIKLYSVVLSTEIADNGREGVTLGLIFGFQVMVGVCAHILSAQLGDWLPFKVSMEEVMDDRAHTRSNVISAAMIVFAINSLALAIVFVLPEQKLDAQQLRAFGGYNRYASYGVGLIFALLFVANCVLNLLALV